MEHADKTYSLKRVKSIFYLSFVVICLLMTAGTNGCRHSASKAVADRLNVRVFSPSEVCTYPANSSIKKFHFLGGGAWQPVTPEDREIGFNCGIPQNIVQLFGNGEGIVNVEYIAAGSEAGPTMISIEYSVSAINLIDNEPTFRNVYTRFVDEIVQQGLNNPLPELAQRKIRNLDSYSTAGGGSGENFIIGDGFVNLSRSRDADNGTISVQTQIFSDGAFKLE